MGWTRIGAKFPYSYAYGILKKLRQGVRLGLITIRINKKRETTGQRGPDDLGCPLCSAGGGARVKLH
jgi:hypothetical protein